VSRRLAICEECRVFFYTTTVDTTDGQAARGQVDARGDRCPDCGTKSSGLDSELHTILRDILSRLVASKPSPEELKQLIEALESLVTQPSKVADASSSLMREIPPRFQWLVRFIPEDQANWIALLTLLIAIATLVLDFYVIVAKPVNEATVHQIIEQVIRERVRIYSKDPTKLPASFDYLNRIATETVIIGETRVLRGLAQEFVARHSRISGVQIRQKWLLGVNSCFGVMRRSPGG
jgi:hypothetical protein